MYKLYRKNPENFAFVWIGIYCLVQSMANGISANNIFSAFANHQAAGPALPIVNIVEITEIILYLAVLIKTPQKGEDVK